MHYKLKIYRIRDFPEAVAIGLSWGAAISFTPLLGFHLIICYLGTLKDFLAMKKDDKNTLISPTELCCWLLSAAHLDICV